MKIYFVETDSSEQEFFQCEFGEHELHFVDALGEVADDAEVISTFIYSRIDAPFLDQHPAVRLIATRSTTYDHVDLESCAQRNVTVCKVASYGDHVVAEHTFALILALTRRLREAMVVERNSHFSYAALRGIELKGKTLGIIGSGRIGVNVALIAKAFGMKVIACDIKKRSSLAASLGFEYVGCDELLGRAEIISLHAALTTESYHLLDDKAFAKCQSGVLIINTARGRLIDTQALIQAMDKGIVAGAGLDVLGVESVFRRKASRIISDQIVEHLHGKHSSEDSPKDAGRVKQFHKLMLLDNLLARPNVIFTPHTAFNCVEAIERINEATADNIKAFTGGAPINTVSPETQDLALRTLGDEVEYPAMAI